MSIKMTDVAKHCGFSVATVSNALTGKHYVSPEVKEKVMKSVEALNYHINLNARSLKTSKTKTIGVILPDITKLFFSEVMRGILEEAENHDYKVMVLSSYFDFNIEKECISSLRCNNVDGIIIDTCCDYHNLKSYAEELVSYEGRYIPISFLESAVEGGLVSSVRIDTYYWAVKITTYLLSLGKNRILYIGGMPHLPQEHEMLIGYKQALTDHNIKINEKLIFDSDYVSGSSYDIVSNALESNLKFDAIQASNDEAAIGALNALKDHGISVPEKIVLTGFDNLFPTTLISPAITTVNVPRHEMGIAAVSECIHNIVDSTLPHRNLVVGADIIKRGSTEPGLPTKWELNYW